MAHIHTRLCRLSHACLPQAGSISNRVELLRKRYKKIEGLDSRDGGRKNYHGSLRRQRQLNFRSSCQNNKHLAVELSLNFLKREKIKKNWLKRVGYKLFY